MDLLAYVRVVRRFWWLVTAGFVLAAVLAVLAVARVNSQGVSYRTHEVWQSRTDMLLTQKGFPWGRTVLPEGTNLGQFAGLTDLYSQFANSDAVQNAMLREGASKTWTLSAAPAPASSQYTTLPVIALYATAYTPNEAVKAIALGQKAFLGYVSAQQRAAAIPLHQRVVLQILQDATPPVLIQPRKKTLPIVVFAAVLTLTLGLAFVLENARPRKPAVALATGSATARSALAGGRQQTTL